MKKLLVLMLVVGMASLASAAFELQGTDNAGSLVGDGEFGAYFVSVAGDAADIGLLYDGSLAELVDYTGLDDDLTAGIDFYAGEATNAIYFAVFADAVDPENNTPLGDVLSLLLAEGGSRALVTLHSADDLSALGSVTLVPEPISLALLGLGGLFLRRRK